MTRGQSTDNGGLNIMPFRIYSSGEHRPSRDDPAPILFRKVNCFPERLNCFLINQRADKGVLTPWIPDDKALNLPAKVVYKLVSNGLMDINP